MYLLDTNIVSYWMRGDERVIERLKAHAPSELSLSAVTLGEILYGIQKSRAKRRERQGKVEGILSMLELYPYDEPAARRYATIRCQLESSGEAISERDTQIAAIALSRQLTVVTHNVREFARVPRLKVVDWAR